MLGSHLSISGGMHNALLTAETLQLESVQVFTKSQKQWAAKPLETETIDTFRAHADRLKFNHIVAHDSYLINLASGDPLMLEKSMNAFKIEMERCDQLGIAYLVTHPGAHGGRGIPEGVRTIIDSFNRILDQDKNGQVTICLETTAGQGSSLGHEFEQLAEMIDGIENKNRLAVCVDTCHILAAGYDIRTAAGMKKTLKQMDETFGLDRVKVWHFNDSKKELGSRVDRHEHIGLGHVGVEAFEVILRDKRFHKTPKILETAKEEGPDGRPWDEINLEVLRKMQH